MPNGEPCRSSLCYSAPPNPSRSNPITPCHSLVPARCHPNDRVVVAGFVAIHKANNEIIKPAKSDIKCAASVTIARLLAKYPPEKWWIERSISECKSHNGTMHLSYNASLWLLWMLLGLSGHKVVNYRKSSPAPSNTPLRFRGTKLISPPLF